MRYLAPEIVSTYFVPSLYEGASGFSSANVDGDGPAAKGGDDA